jgi:hypothetical protein
MLELGQGLPKDIARAIRDYKLSSGLACPDRMFGIAGIGSRSRTAAPRPSASTSSRRRTRSWHSSSCRGPGGEGIRGPGHFSGLVHLADLLESGAGVERVEGLLATAKGRQSSAAHCNYGLALEKCQGCAAARRRP